MLSAGDFLSLRHIRGQLPQELVDAYDKFQEQVDKYLSSVQARKALEKEEKRVEEEEEQKYAKSTIEDLTRLCMKVEDWSPVLPTLFLLVVGMAAVGLCELSWNQRRFRWLLRMIKLLTALEDNDTIKWLDFFCRYHNFKMIKNVALVAKGS
ncbi:nuclear intron maturase 3 [Quercus suber]|uniref:Nuclear intron maturase 3 n=1 Tax=Quercus suber TaxID=58331 RepID=A0AAW0MAJ3_QUESU